MPALNPHSHQLNLKHLLGRIVKDRHPSKRLLIDAVAAALKSGFDAGISMDRTGRVYIYIKLPTGLFALSYPANGIDVGDEAEHDSRVNANSYIGSPMS